MLHFYSSSKKAHKSSGTACLCACVTEKKEHTEVVLVWHKWRVSHRPPALVKDAIWAMRESADLPSSSQTQISALSLRSLRPRGPPSMNTCITVCLCYYSGLQMQRGWGGQWLQFYLVRGTGQLLLLPASKPVMKWKCWEGCLALGLLSAVQTEWLH